MTDQARHTTKRGLVALLTLAVAASVMLGYAENWRKGKELRKKASAFQALSSAMDQAGLSYWETDPKTGATSWSPALWGLYGLSQDRVETWELRERRIHLEDRDLVSEAFSSAVESGGGYRVEYRFRSDSGNYVSVLESGAMDWERGVMVGVCIVHPEEAPFEVPEALIYPHNHHADQG